MRSAKCSTKCNKANKGADNAFLWFPPNGKRADDVLIANATLLAVNQAYNGYGRIYLVKIPAKLSKV